MLKYFQKQYSEFYKKEELMNKKTCKFRSLILGLLLFASAIFLSQPQNAVKVQAATVGTPTVTSVSASGTTKAIVRWSRISGCTGYRIYRRTAGSSSWKTIVTLPGSSYVSYTDSSLSPGTCYFYTVRAYKNSNGTTSWGSYNQTGRYVITNLSTHPFPAQNTQLKIPFVLPGKK
jgi:fibronectin type 3 domain-containing protein